MLKKYHNIYCSLASLTLWQSLLSCEARGFGFASRLDSKIIAHDYIWSYSRETCKWPIKIRPGRKYLSLDVLELSNWAFQYCVKQNGMWIVWPYIYVQTVRKVILFTQHVRCKSYSWRKLPAPSPPCDKLWNRRACQWKADNIPCIMQWNIMDWPHFSTGSKRGR